MWAVPLSWLSPLIACSCILIDHMPLPLVSTISANGILINSSNAGGSEFQKTHDK